MPMRPSWSNDYWKQMDKDTARKIRTSCPRCGSTNTHYNEQFMTWRCGKCEHIFVIRGIGDKKPWWKQIFGR